MNASISLHIGLVLMSCAFILQLIGLVSPFWISVDTSIGQSTAGLWKSCGSDASRTICFDSALYLSDDSWLKAVRGLSIFGFISLVVAAVMSGLKIYLFKDQEPIVLVTLGTGFIGVVAILISIAVYAAKTNDIYAGTLFTYNFAFAFSILGMLTGFGACLILLLVVLNEKQLIAVFK
ncbi:uncharacterized protein LOC133174997 [Saccostrea echinata]|uniref:uncharacterized protein LOC133174997 n=1 Tax=Saccostrea echinata TaxID=191078 RepID=UPI002A801C25|nr:uncharacterized protein LOC133174997 [Saccostrea echinata]XP_061166188.1 uncharacterized protein LOC133174997 [Saccostrea echinata]XP_061166250.1 uncharacterized protein LOC133174997 [Saccostrea echinata]